MNSGVEAAKVGTVHGARASLGTVPIFAQRPAKWLALSCKASRSFTAPSVDSCAVEPFCEAAFFLEGAGLCRELAVQETACHGYEG